MINRSASFSPFAEPGARATLAPRVGLIAAAPPPAIVDEAAAMCGAELRHVTPDALLAGTIMTDELVWAMVDDAGAAWVEELVERHADAAFPVVLHTSIAALDGVVALADRIPDATVLVDPDRVTAVAALAGAMRGLGDAVHAPGDAVREREIESLQEEVQRISRMLARLAQEPAPRADAPSPFIEDHVSAAARAYHAGPASDYAGPTVTAREVRAVIRQRRLRDELFDPELFADPAWDMLLDLYAAKLDRARVSVSSLCIAAAVPATTALRWIKTLTESGLFERIADQHDARRIFVTLSDGATAAMHRYFARLSDARLAI